MSPFHQILGNNLVANITNFTVWFAVTFWVYLETKSVFATGMIAGIYLVMTAGLGFWLGGTTDTVMIEGYDAGVSFRSMHDPASDTTCTVIANWSDGAWPVVKHFAEPLFGS